MNYKPVKLFIAGWVLVSAGFSSAVPVDPCTPAEYHALKAEERRPARSWLPVRIRQLEQERGGLLERIEQLPQHAPTPLSDHVGYHSVPPKEGALAEDSVSQITVQFEFDPGLGAIALAPALVPGEDGSYAFPRRFKIEVMDRKAKWIGDETGEYYLPPPPYEWTEVVNWMEEDFPDPGPYPVFFSIENVLVHQLRLTVLPDSADAPYHALGELYLFRKNIEVEGAPLADNMMAWDTVLLSTSNSLTRPPLWDKSYLRDGIVGLGMSLSEEIFDAEDFMVSWDGRGIDDDSVQIILDVGRVQPIGRVQLWPAEAPLGMAVSRFGFPGRVSVELSSTPDFSQGDAFFKVNNVHGRKYGNSLLNVMCNGEKARYIRLVLEDLDKYNGETILGLGEIQIAEYDQVWSRNCAISAEGIPPAGVEQLSRLVDGFSRKRQILPEAEWIRGLALRRPLDLRLAVVEKELELAHDAWTAFKFRASIWGGGLLCFGLLGAMGLQRLQRRNVLKRLKHRITRDLHDEVGSCLGGITLAAHRMEKAGASEDELVELSLMAREASAALKEVVWVIDQPQVFLPELLKKMAERVERVLAGVELVLEMPEQCPDHKVPLTFKRHLMMFFKEAVHNCARHSGATSVLFRVSVCNNCLSIRLEDNGCGFDPDEERDGWGVDSMGKRAEELGGKMELQTEPGKGTTVELTVPLDALQLRSDHSYQTSN